MEDKKSVIIGGDHRAAVLLDGLFKNIQQAGGWHVVGCFPTKKESVDYPKVSEKVGKRVSCGDFDYGILACGSGIGVSIAANKIIGVRAALVFDQESARGTRKHNNSNILCLAADKISIEDAIKITYVFFETPFDGGRHTKRLNQIKEIEQNNIPYN